MAKRPIHAKKVAKLRKLLRQTPEGYINLIDWLRLHRYAQTAGEARKLILDKRVRVNSHVVGRELITLPALDDDGRPVTVWQVQPFVPAHFRDKLLVTDG